METKNIDECEIEIKLDEEFVISRSEYDEFARKLQELIYEYRI